MNLVALILLVVFQGTGALKTGVVTGRLLNNSGASLANVRIALSPVADGTELTGITQTDATGGYRIENVLPGEYYVVAGRIVDSPTYFPGVASRASAIRVAVSAGSPLNVPEFRMSGVTLRGRLVQEQLPGGPVMAPVSIRLDRLTPSVALSLIGPPTIGAFEFSDLTAGEYRMSFIGNLVLPSMKVSIAATDIDDFQVPVPLSALVATIDGDLRIEGGAPMPPVLLALKDTNGKYNTSRIRETFSVRRLPLGDYTVTVSGLPDGYILRTITAGGANLPGETLALTPAATPRLVINVGIDQSAFLRISGRITNREDYKLPTSIELSGVKLGSSITSAIRPDGSFDFQMLLPGTYTVRLIPDITNISRTIVVDNQTATNIEIPLRVPNTRKITGVIAGHPPQPVNGVADMWVPILQRAGQRGGGGPPLLRGIPGPNGSFEFANVEPGSYQIVLMRTCAGCDSSIIMMDTAVSVVVEDKDIGGVQLFGR